jgi:HPt (histidine-containing phosphotransfer) domain-containing protein
VKDLPIIGLTAHAMSEARERAIAVGMNAFVTKPFRISDLDAALQNLGIPVAPVIETETQLHTVDLSGLRAEWRAAGILNKMPDIVKTFIEESTRELSLLEAACGRKNWAAVASIAHKLKSSVAALHVQRLAKLLKTIEIAAGGKSDSREDLQQLVTDAAREWEAVRKVFMDALST